MDKKITKMAEDLRKEMLNVKPI